MTVGTLNLDSRTYNTYPDPSSPGYNYVVKDGYFHLHKWSGGDSSSTELKVRKIAGIKTRAGFVKQVRFLQPHGYNMSKDSGSYVYWLAKAKDRARWDYASRPVTKGSKAQTPIPQEVYYQLANKLRDKIFGSGFNPLVSLGEMPRALSMIDSRATRLYNSLDALRPTLGGLRNWRGAIRNLGMDTTDPRALRAEMRARQGYTNVSAFWLEIQYGWRPLIQDLDNAAAFLAQSLYDPNAMSQPSVRVRRNPDPTVVLEPPDVFTWHCFAKKVTTHRAQLIATNLSLPRGVPLAPALASAATVAWELLPYSFVADWVIPIGSYLEALRTRTKIQGQFVYSVLTETKWSDPRIHSSMVLGPQLTVSAFDAEETLVTFTREVHNEIYVPPPIGDISPSSVFRNWKRAANAIALLSSLRGQK